MSEHIKKYLKDINNDCNIVNKSFFLKGINSKGVLLVHGWTSTPYEMRALGEYLNKKGYSVYAPLLSGHGTKPEDLKDVKWEDWEKDILDAYDFLKKTSQDIFAVGMSFGGTLTLLLASQKRVVGLILMSTPYKMRYEKIIEKVVKVIAPFKKFKDKSYPKILGNDEMCLTQVISYQKYPINSLYEAQKAIKSSLMSLNKINNPVMIIQSRDDHVISRNSMEIFEKKLKSDFIRKRKIKNAYHNFIGDTKNNYIFKDIVEFIEDCYK